jgi:hypothetical protein
MNSRPSTERPSHPFSPNISNLCIIGVAAVVLAAPMLGYGPMPQGHDTDEHLNFARYFGEQFWGGEWYPRWLIGMNHGLGSPPSLYIRLSQVMFVRYCNRLPRFVISMHSTWASSWPCLPPGFARFSG